MSRPPGGWVPWAGLGLLEGDSGRGGGHPSRPGGSLPTSGSSPGRLEPHPCQLPFGTHVWPRPWALLFLQTWERRRLWPRFAKAPLAAAQGCA